MRAVPAPNSNIVLIFGFFGNKSDKRYFEIKYEPSQNIPPFPKVKFCFTINGEDNN